MSLPIKRFEHTAEINERELLVSARNVSKKFCMRLRRSMAHGIVDLSKNMFGIRPEFSNLRKDEFWALDDISFDLRRGEALGLIGANGSGKTTLLRLLSGILPPDKGEIMVKGRVGALIAVGAGFHPHMTGRENIYLNGTILGMTREEINSKFEDIVNFAEIDKFLDAPVSTYSSGMRVRLGFSIAIYVEPDILLVDEILAVGDVAFRSKCYRAMGKLMEKCAVIFVSHNREALIRICDYGILLDQGTLTFQGDIGEALTKYEDITGFLLNHETYLNCYEPCKAFDVILEETVINYYDDLIVRLALNLKKKIEKVYIRIVISNNNQVACAEWNNKGQSNELSIERGEQTITVGLNNIMLRDGQYYLSVMVHGENGKTVIGHAHQCKKITVMGNKTVLTDYVINGCIHGDVLDD